MPNKSKKVTVRLSCRTADGAACGVGELGPLEVALGGGQVPPVVESALKEMQPGERRTIRVPAGQAALFRLPRPALASAEKKTPPGIAYEFGPGNGGDVLENIPPSKERMLHLPTGTDLLIEVEVVAID